VNKQNKSIEGVPSAPEYPDFHQNKDINLTHSIDSILIAVTFFNCIKNSWRAIDKMRKQKKWNLNILLQLVSIILALLKVLLQIESDGLNPDDDE
jgi:hypothetical protein